MKIIFPIFFINVAWLLLPVFSNEAVWLRPLAFSATYGESQQTLQLSGKCADDKLVAFSAVAFGKRHSLSDERMASLGAIIVPPEVVQGCTKSGIDWYQVTFTSLQSNQPVAHFTVENSENEPRFEKAPEAVPNPAEAKIIPKDGFVPDEQTALKVAEAILTATEGNEVVQSYVPYKAKLRDEVWIIEGTTKGPGGTPVLEISKRNGTIMRLYRTQ